MNIIGKATFLLVGAAAGAVYLYGMPAVERAVAGGLPKPPPPACETRGVGSVSLRDIRTVMAYVRAHPVPHRHGMIAGIVTGDYCAGPGGSWAQILDRSWRGIGHPLNAPTVWCGKGNRPCSVPDFNDIGAYEYVPRSGIVRQPGDVQVITLHAVPAAIAGGA